MDGMDSLLLGLLHLWHAYRYIILALCLLAIPAHRLLIRRRSPAHSEPKADIKLTNTSQIRSDKSVATVDRSPASTESTAAIPLVSGKAPRRAIGQRKKSASPSTAISHAPTRIQPIVFYFSLGGVTKTYAEDAFEKLASRTKPDNLIAPQLLDLSTIDYDDYFISGPKDIVAQDSSIQPFYLILLPSYDIDTEINNFVDHLRETHNDFRIDTASLSSLAGYSVFGFGDSEGWPTEDQGFCFQAKKVDAWMARLTARKRGYPLGMADTRSAARTSLDDWLEGIYGVLTDLAAGNGLGDGVSGSGDPLESDDESSSDLEMDTGKQAVTDNRSSNSKSSKKPTKSTMPDLEDLASQSGPLPVDFTTYTTTSNSSALSVPNLPEMVPKSSPTHAALTKQGYTIVGSHSGVKICRWTKSALRGRGSCYKFSFYGIRSHLCMETTPSLSCSNKCVFCWRKSTNPVGTTWKWQVDPPDMIFDGVKEGHYKKIKMMKGVPGVRADRYAEAMRIRHCALSLVGEPIFYPHINEFTAMLHREHISSFLVCNAQHPDQLATLQPVTQLYVSIDASNKESLRKIDRPLHRDFWERFQRCLDILREKRFTQRTVFRLTLVKGFNIEEEAEGYADLVEKALPGFVEVKGVTYCGTSTSSSAGLTMQNVPFYAEVCTFVEVLTAALLRRGLDYGISAEHAHSCCILIADRKRFHKEDGWHTLIDYAKFFECLESGKTFAPEDYIGEKTPDWAIYGSETGGFNPADERVDRKGRPKEDVEIIRS